MSKIQQNIAEYMNLKSKKVFMAFHVSIISSSMKAEFESRKGKIYGRTNLGRSTINKAVAKIANEKMYSDFFTEADIVLYKRSLAEEAEFRTGKCKWGFKVVRQRLGYNPDTGYESVEEMA